jgi:hypothetical protein
LALERWLRGPDDPALEPDTSRVGSGDLACHDRWLSGWIRASFPWNLCLAHEREHDEERQGDFHAAFSSAVAILFFVTGSFLGNLFSQSRLRHSYRIVFGLITSEVATVAGFEWDWSAESLFRNRVVCLAMVHDQSSFI